jgi:hypothetical protein
MVMIKLMRTKRIKTFGLASAIVSSILIVVACTSTDPTGPEVEPQGGPPWAATDSAWKVIENLRYAYITMDLELYMSCFRDDFEFWPLPVQQDSCWGYDIEEQFHQNMFDYVEVIELQFWGDTEYSWSGDSTGQSLALVRIFDLKIYVDLFYGFIASGGALFICSPDSTGEWYIWQWYDQSGIKESLSWGAIKALF